MKKEIGMTEQCSIADEILERLEIIDPTCILAGGAPRDWVFGRPASDLDFFIHLRRDLNWDCLSKQLRQCLPDVLFDRDEWRKEFPDIYKNNPHLKAVLNFKYGGQDCQLMVMLEPTFKVVVPEFPLTICQAWYKNKNIRTTKTFETCLEKKIIYKTNELYAHGHKYIDKIRKKFPDFRYFDSREKAMSYVFGD